MLSIVPRFLIPSSEIIGSEMFEKCRTFEAFRQLLSRASAVLISLHLLQSDILYSNFYLFFANLIVESYLTVLVCISWVADEAELLFCNKYFSPLYFLFCELFVPVLWAALSDVCQDKEC